jgi:hypothetical protein
MRLEGGLPLRIRLSDWLGRWCPWNWCKSFSAVKTSVSLDTSTGMETNGLVFYLLSGGSATGENVFDVLAPTSK